MEGQSTRQNKVSREIQRELSELIRRKGMAFWSGAMVSVSEVRVSPDLSLARAYVSVFPSDKHEAVMKTLAEENKALRGELGRIMGKQLRIVPELDFHLDTTMDYAERIEELLKK